MKALLRRIPETWFDLKWGVLMGGPSPERAFSLRSGERVCRTLKDLGLPHVALDCHMDLAQNLKSEQVDLCFLATHGCPGEDGQIQGLLEHLGLHYSGARVSGSSLAINKLASKSMLAHRSIPTPPWLEIDRNLASEAIARTLAEGLGFPLLIKPIYGGSSLGIRLVHNLMECRTALEQLLPEHHHLFAEKHIEGREFTVSVMEDSRGHPFTLPIMELDPQNLFYDYDAKWNADKKDFIVPAELPKDLETSLKEMALEAHRHLEMRDLSRSDFMVDGEGQPHYLETNSIPGFTENSDLPAQAQAAGLTFEEVVVNILWGPWRRSQR